jgi:radical SAM protein with 4Fe4S-binding SPASM domain
METLDYGAFSRKMHGRLRAAGVPLNGTIEVTRRCPLECAHCYNNLPMTDHAAAQHELTYDEHCRILDEIADAGCLWLLYTGGEIFARRDFLDIYRYAKRKGFLITLFTNGNLVTSAVADALVEYPPFAIEITLYGHTRETYERLTGIPGSYDKCMRGVRVLKERGLPLKLKTVAVTINKHEVFDMQRFAEEELGVEFKFDAMMNPRLDCSQAPLAVRLSPEECVELDLIDPRRMEEWNIFADRALRIPELPPPSEELYGCGGGLTSFAINPYGELSICTLSQRELFDLRRGSFADGWTSYLRQIRARRVTRLTKCRACQLGEMCGMCPANGELESGDAETPVDFLCHTAHLRAHAFGFPIPAHGECEYCEGGEKHAELAAEAARLSTIRPHDPVSPSRRLLPMLNVATTGCASGGCSSCQGH